MSFLSKQQQHRKQRNKCQNLQALLMTLVLISTALYSPEDYTVSGCKEDRGAQGQRLQGLYDYRHSFILT
jgi:hypothetical protein